MAYDFNTATVTIAAGATGLSGAIDVGSYAPVAIIMPGTWVAAVLSFQASIDGTNYFDLYEQGTEYTVPTTTNIHNHIDASVFAGVRWLKIRSGTAAAAVDQTATRTLTLVSRRVVAS